MNVMSEEDYLSSHGFGMEALGEFAFHSGREGTSRQTWKRLLKIQQERDRQWEDERKRLRKEYWTKVKNGEFRPPSRIERLIQIANGHPDNRSVQAAIRLLLNYGLKYDEDKIFCLKK